MEMLLIAGLGFLIQFLIVCIVAIKRNNKKVVKELRILNSEKGETITQARRNSVKWKEIARDLESANRVYVNRINQLETQISDRIKQLETQISDRVKIINSQRREIRNLEDVVEYSELLEEGLASPAPKKKIRTPKQKAAKKKFAKRKPLRLA